MITILIVKKVPIKNLPSFYTWKVTMKTQKMFDGAKNICDSKTKKPILGKRLLIGNTENLFASIILKNL